MSRYYQKHKLEQGQIIIFAIVFGAIMLVVSTALLGYTTLNVRSSRNAYNNNRALYLAEAGIDKAIYELNQNANYAGETDTVLSGGTMSVSITSIDSNNKRITATGYVPNSTNPLATQVVKATTTIDSSIVSFNFGVQVGIGGLVMDNSSKVEGNVFSNGNISGGSGVVTGDVIVAAGAAAAINQQWTTQDTNYNFGNSSSVRDVAQSFVPSQTGTLTKVSVYIKRFNTPADLTVRIVTNNSSSEPSTTTVGGTSTIASPSVPTSYGWIDATFSTPPNLISGTKYWLMLNAGNNSNNYYVWGKDSANGYANNIAKYSSNWNTGNPGWTNVGGGLGQDLDFKTYMGGVITSLSNIIVNGNATAQQMLGCQVDMDAYYETINTCTVTGATHPGSAIPGPVVLPISDAQIQEWKDAAGVGDPIDGPYTIDGFVTLGPKKILGDLILSNGSTLNLTGPVWVVGNITLNQTSSVTIDASLGNSGTVLMADNASDPLNSSLILVENNTTITGNGNPGSYPLILTTSTNTTAALDLRNRALGAIFYASKGTIEVVNTAGGKELSANKIHLNPNAVVIYDSGLQNASFTNGPGGSWTYLAGSYVIVP